MTDDDRVPTFTPTKPGVRVPKKDAAPKVSTPPASADDVKRAMATMDGIYGAVGAFLLFGAQLPQTAELLADRKDELDAANRDAFLASPQLARLIAGAAPIAAVSAFFVAHATVAFSIVTSARQEQREKNPDVEITDVNYGEPASSDMG